jgi:hypothetical protein
MQINYLDDEQAKRLAELLYVLPADVGKKLIGDVVKYFVAEGPVQQLFLTFCGENSGLITKDTNRKIEQPLYSNNTSHKRKIAFG